MSHETLKTTIGQAGKIFIASISAVFFSDPGVIAEQPEQGSFICRSTDGAAHTVTVKLPLTDNDGRAREEQIRVVYHGTSRRGRGKNEPKLEAAMERGDSLYTILAAQGEALAADLADQVVALPDVFDGETPVEPTAEFFSTIDVFLLNRISRAIAIDRFDRNRFLVHHAHFPLLLLWFTEDEARQEAIRIAEETWRPEDGFTSHAVILREVSRATFVKAQVFMNLKESLRWLSRLVGFSNS